LAQIDIFDHLIDEGCPQTSTDWVINEMILKHGKAEFMYNPRLLKEGLYEYSNAALMTNLKRWNSYDIETDRYTHYDAHHNDSNDDDDDEDPQSR